MNNKEPWQFDAVSIEDVKKQFDQVNARGVITLKEIRGIGMKLQTWSQYPCEVEKINNCNQKSYCRVQMSVSTNRRNWRLIPALWTVIGVREGKGKTYIVYEHPFRDFVDEGIFPEFELEPLTLYPALEVKR